MNLKKYIFIILIVGFVLNLVGQIELNKLKAAYIEKFTRFIEWPPAENAEADKVFVIGYFHKTDFIETVQKFLSELKIQNRTVEFIQLQPRSRILDCDLVYIPKFSEQEIEQILLYTKDNPILTIGQSKNYAAKGVHINFYLQDDKLKFEINPIAVKRSGLKISHLLLQLASIVNAKEI